MQIDSSSTQPTDQVGAAITRILETASEDAPRWDEIRTALGDDDLFGRGPAVDAFGGVDRWLCAAMQALQQTVGPGDSATLTDLVPMAERDWVELARTHGCTRAHCRGYGRGTVRALRPRTRHLHRADASDRVHP